MKQNLSFIIIIILTLCFGGCQNSVQEEVEIDVNNDLDMISVEEALSRIRSNNEFNNSSADFNILFRAKLDGDNMFQFKFIVDEALEEMYDVKIMMLFSKRTNEYFYSRPEYTPPKLPSKDALEKLNYIIPNSDDHKGIIISQVAYFDGELSDLKENYFGSKALIVWKDKEGNLYEDYFISDESNTDLTIEE